MLLTTMWTFHIATFIFCVYCFLSFLASVVGLSAPLDSPSPFALSLSELKTLADYLVVNSEGEAETVEVATVSGSVAVAKGYAHAPIVVVPAATTNNAVHTLRWSGWIGLRIALIVSIPIVAPLPYVAAHVIQAKFVGFLGLDWVGLAAAIITIPRYFVGIVAAAVPISSTILASSCCILPFGFGRKSKLLSRQSIQLLDKLLAVVPTYALHGSLIVAYEPRRIAVHYCLPQLLRYFGLSYIVVRKSNAVNQFLVIVCIATLLRGRSHAERATLYLYHFELYAIDVKGLLAWL